MSTMQIYDMAGFSPPLGKSKQFAEGVLQIYQIPPEWTEKNYQEYWLPETDGKGKIVRPARMSKNDKAKYLATIACNQIMNQGRTQVLAYIGSPSGNTTAWAQFFAIGTGAITATSPTDTSLSNEVFRKAPATFSVTGTQVDINVQLSTTDAQVSMTNGGIFGNGASSTLGSGSLLTHCLFSFTKSTQAIAIDYVINLL